jgi:hypothetical protein
MVGWQRFYTMVKTFPSPAMLTQQMSFWTSPKLGNPNPEGTNEYILGVAIGTFKQAEAELQARQVPTVDSNVVAQHSNMRYHNSKSHLVAK